MDKLRKYIQECWGDIVYSDYNKVATLEDLEYNYRYIRFILSPEAMFIKWLIDNDKIDLMKLKKWIEDNKFYCAKWGKITNMLLMLLSIQDNPIEFLVSILE